MSIFVTRSSLPSFDEYIEEIMPIFESKQMTNMGPVHQKLQLQLTEYLQVPELSLYVNGHMALETAIQAFDFPKGAEVITTPFTFVSTTNAIVRQGLVPVFCDINPNNYTIDAAKIEELITDKTAAILPVHVYGNICDVETIQKIADKHGLKVLYDGAHAFGCAYKGKTVGNFGDMTMFSFHATKVFNTIEGGAVAYQNSELRRRLDSLRNFGIQEENEITDFGGNAKLDEFRAAMGICNLRHISENIAERKRVAAQYDERLKNVPGIRRMQLREGTETNYSYYPVYFDAAQFGENRDSVCERLKIADIFARKYFYPASNDLKCYKNAYQVQETPVAREASLNILCLPIYSDLSAADVDRICDVILER